VKVLALNAGSSSFKFAVVDTALKNDFLRGQANGLEEVLAQAGHVDAVGCRVVHGGPDFRDSAVVTDEVVGKIRKLQPLAPLHNARDVELIESVRAALPNVPVVAVFDTGFHRTLPAVASTYAVPRDLKIKRYGFHGISYRYVVNRMVAEADCPIGKMIVCHLGSGASVCAVKKGKSVETSMGMTPLEGLVMGTRCGDLDPGIVLYLQRELGMDLSQVDDLLNHSSGLLGLSGQSGDVRVLQQAASAGDKECEFALEMFAHRLAKYIGSYFVVLEGLDALVFTGGIGENSKEMRRRVCRKLGALGIGQPLVSNPDGDVVRISGGLEPSTWVVKTNEERQIAIETAQALA